MTLPTRFASLFVAGVASWLTSGCAAGDLFSRRVQTGRVMYDQQTCVENALRDQPDSATVRDAAITFGSACRSGETASCSVLGVMYELGRGVPRDVPRAAALYDSACKAQNPRACGNLGALLLGTEIGAPEPARALSLLRTACDGREARACERLGRVYRDGDGERRDPMEAAALFDAACAQGYVPACLDLAEELAAPGAMGVAKGV